MQIHAREITILPVLLTEDQAEAFWKANSQYPKSIRQKQSVTTDTTKHSLGKRVQNSSVSSSKTDLTCNFASRDIK